MLQVVNIKWHAIEVGNMPGEERTVLVAFDDMSVESWPLTVEDILDGEIRAGRRHDVAPKQASILLNGRDYPHVLEYITELRQERERRYGVSTIGQLERLHQLSAGAEEAGQFSAAINAEKIRSALGGLTIDRRETINTIDQLSRDEITTRLAALQKQYPQAFQIEGTYKDVTNEQGTGGELLDAIEAEPTEEVLRNAD